MTTLQERAVLMRFSAGLPGTSRKDKRTTAEVKAEKGLGENSGKWIKDLYPPGALQAIKQLQTEARDYHNTVTFPYGGSPEDDESSVPEDGKRRSLPLASVGILPGALIPEYGDKIRELSNKLGVLVADFCDKAQEWVDWAVQQHNGTFDPSNYPGCVKNDLGQWVVDVVEFTKKMRSKFYLYNEVMPVPNAEHFTASMSALLGVDVETVNMRVRDAALEAQKELLRRMTDPVQHMACRLANKPCTCSGCKGKTSKTDSFHGTVVTNIADIAALVPKMNLTGDPQIDAFAKEMESLTRYSPEVLRDDKATRAEAALKAEAVFKRLAGYKL